MNRLLIVNADDFGMSAGINRGVIEAHENGIVTSTSLMVRWPDAAEAARRAREHADLGVGLHVDLGEWIWQSDQVVPLYEVVDPSDAGAVDAEVRRQLETFRELVGADPTHLDAHQHVHRRQPVRGIVRQVASELGVPVRFYHPSVTLCARFYGQKEHGAPAPRRITVKHLQRILNSLPDGAHELMCHPGYGEGLATPYRDERIVELRTLTDPQIRATIEEGGITLSSFAPFCAT